MSLPPQITNSQLFKKLSADAELMNSIQILREKAETLAGTLVRDAHTFTDHTIKHMDALWQVAQRVLSDEEIDGMSTAEAFLLAAGFYLHDIGMSYGSTAAGKEILMQTPEFIGVMAGASSASNLEQLKEAALSHAIRVHHARKSEELATGPIPGTTDYLIEPKSVRDQLGAICGRIAASHHWSIDRVEAELGNQEVVPLANNRVADLGFVAGVLRLIDYAHINRERAPILDRELRPTLGEESAKHWDAQKNIDGPSRSHGSNELAYSALTPIASVDAWWLFYEFARGLDDEIRQVHRFLKSRKVSADRLSLVGVRGANSPENFGKFVKTAGFLPLEVSVKASSITRLVRLLAGESLYGRNFVAPVRELIQNALDAVLLRRATAVSSADRAVSDLPIEIALMSNGDEHMFSVRDWGIGMTKKVIVDHLLTIASDYWEKQFHIDFPAASKKFSPAGRFGIGFLSVFMLGDEIEVSSQRMRNDRFCLSIHGLGKRAELRKTESDTTSGTTVTIRLNSGAKEAFDDLPKKLASYIPMLEVEVSVNWNGVISKIAPNWALKLETVEFKKWVTTSFSQIYGVDSDSGVEQAERWYIRRLHLAAAAHSLEAEAKAWPLGSPEYVEDNVRLIADKSGESLQCLRGFSLQRISTPGFIGIINSSDITPDAARTKGLNIDNSKILERAIASVRPNIAKNLTERKKAGFIPEQLEFVEWCANVFGDCVVAESEFPWIQIVEASGNARFVATSELQTLVSNTSAIFLGLNTSPTEVSKAWLSKSQIPRRHELGVCFSDFHVAYLTSTETRSGSLVELLPDHTRNKLFVHFVETVSKAWCIQVATLINADGMLHKSATVTGMFTR